MQKLLVISVVFSLILGAPIMTFAGSSEQWAEAFDLVGVSISVNPERGDNLLQLARKYQLGQQELLWANPGYTRWDSLEESDSIMLPLRHILPTLRHEGVVVNLPEFRLYHFHALGVAASHSHSNVEPRSRMPTSKQLSISTYPIGIGRLNWQTPVGEMSVIQKIVQPEWTPPESLRREARDRGEELPLVMLPGPLNPLGDFALRLSRSRYLIHGTNKPDGIGMRVSHGCIRLYSTHIEKLYESVKKGLKVTIINQPVKAGRDAKKVMVEIHPTLEEFRKTDLELMRIAESRIASVARSRSYNLYRATLSQAIEEKRGVPIVVGEFH